MMPDSGTDAAQDAVEDLSVFLTAGEAYPAFERAVLAARERVVAGFRIFDTRTGLRSKEARAVGRTWFDLILHKLNAGVRFEITLTDFDPLLATGYHRQSWASARQLAALDALSEGARMDFSIAMHPARAGLMPRLGLWPLLRHRLSRMKRDRFTPGLDALAAGRDRPLVPATHHQKLAVIDGRTLYIGRLDLDERRYDDRAHDRPAAWTWHDVQVMAHGPIVAAAERHLRTFRPVTRGTKAPSPPAPAFLRTLSASRGAAPFHISPRPRVTEVERAHLDWIARTPGPIYLETQFFRHRPLARALERAARRRPELTCVLVLPSAPEDVAFENNTGRDARLGADRQARALSRLQRGFGSRLVVASPAQPRPARANTPARAMLRGAPMIYVHSKVSLFGAQAGIVSSANLNGRSLRWDTEAGLLLRRQAHVRTLWNRVLGHWLPGQSYPDPLKDQAGFIRWLDRALLDNAECAPTDRPHFLLPFPRKPQDRLAQPLPGVPDEMV